MFSSFVFVHLIPYIQKDGYNVKIYQFRSEIQIIWNAKYLLNMTERAWKCIWRIMLVLTIASCKVYANYLISFIFFPLLVQKSTFQIRIRSNVTTANKSSGPRLICSLIPKSYTSRENHIWRGGIHLISMCVKWILVWFFTNEVCLMKMLITGLYFRCKIDISFN